MRVKPVPGNVVYKFGVKNSAYRLGFHPGTDYAASSGTNAVASESGTVTWLPSGSAGNSDGNYGNQMKIKLDSGGALYYCHLSSPIASGHVTTGQVICKTGNTGWATGPHLHIEWRPTDSIDNPQDFEIWLSKGVEVMFNEGDRVNINNYLYGEDRGQHREHINKDWKAAMYAIFEGGYFKQEQRVNSGDVVNMSGSKDASGQKDKIWKKAAYDFLIPNQAPSSYEPVKEELFRKKG